MISANAFYEDIFEVNKEKNDVKIMIDLVGIQAFLNNITSIYKHTLYNKIEYVHIDFVFD